MARGPTRRSRTCLRSDARSQSVRQPGGRSLLDAVRARSPWVPDKSTPRSFRERDQPRAHRSGKRRRGFHPQSATRRASWKRRPAWLPASGSRNPGSASMKSGLSRSARLPGERPSSPHPGWGTFPGAAMRSESTRLRGGPIGTGRSPCGVAGPGTFRLQTIASLLASSPSPRSLTGGDARKSVAASAPVCGSCGRFPAQRASRGGGPGPSPPPRDARGESRGGGAAGDRPVARASPGVARVPPCARRHSASLRTARSSRRPAAAVPPPAPRVRASAWESVAGPSCTRHAPSRRRPETSSRRRGSSASGRRRGCAPRAPTSRSAMPPALVRPWRSARDDRDHSASCASLEGTHDSGRYSRR
jgi:hypothetical protein